MIEFYPEIRTVHVAAVIASGGLFLLRGTAWFAGVRWAASPPLAYLGYTVDTVLLTAALMLMTILDQYPFAQNWLTVKVALVVVYVVLSYAALARPASDAAPAAGVAPPAQPRPTTRLGLFLTALAVYAFIYTVARAHHPLGFLSRL